MFLFTTQQKPPRENPEEFHQLPGAAIDAPPAGNTKL